MSARPSDFDPPPSGPSVPGSALPEGTLRILLVEDEEFDRLALRRYIVTHHLPYLLSESNSVADARTRLRYGGYDAVLVDHRLPDGSGFDVIRVAGPVPVIFMSALSDPALAVRAIKAGAADYLVKDHRQEHLGLLPHTLRRAVQERRLQAGLRAAQQQLQQFLEFLPAPAATLDNEGRLTSFNRQAQALWGRSPQPGETLERFCGAGRVLDSAGRPAEAGAWGRAPAGQELLVENYAGRRHHVLAYANPLIDESGRTEGTILIWIDVTERRRLENHRQALEAQLQRSRRIEAVGTLAGSMAHEFNNLLTAILGNLQLAELDVPEDHAARRHLEEAVASSRRARDLVARMLTFSDQVRGRRVPARIAPVVEEAARRLRACLPANITLGLSVDECPAVTVDAAELGEAVMQLGLNAIQAMHETGGRLQLTLQHMAPTDEFRARHPLVGPTHTIRLTVQDTGPGAMAEGEACPFEPFWAMPAEEIGRTQGLAGIHTIMKRLRGVIAIESAPGVGTLVHLLFPAAETDFPPGTAP